jgi:hypothetical protein
MPDRAAGLWLAALLPTVHQEQGHAEDVVRCETRFHTLECAFSLFSIRCEPLPTKFLNGASLGRRSAAIENRFREIQEGSITALIMQARLMQTRNLYCTISNTASDPVSHMRTQAWEHNEGAQCRGVAWDLLPLPDLCMLAETIGEARRSQSILFRSKTFSSALVHHRNLL